jgi:transposase
METLLTHCAALDVHKAMVQVCCLTPDHDGNGVVQERQFSTYTNDLIALRDWLREAKVTHVAMESTGSYWRPIYNILEGHFELLLVNPRHVKNVPGRKTDVNDARWLAQLLQHGLLKPSFVPPEQQRILQDLTRIRTSLVEEQNRLVNRIQKTLEDANIKLACVASDVVGISGRQILAALLGGERDPAGLAQLARGRMRSKIADLEVALQGHLKPHHALMRPQKAWCAPSESCRVISNRIMRSFSPNCCARSIAWTPALSAWRQPLKNAWLLFGKRSCCLTAFPA